MTCHSKCHCAIRACPPRLQTIPRPCPGPRAADAHALHQDLLATAFTAEALRHAGLRLIERLELIEIHNLALYGA